MIADSFFFSVLFSKLFWDPCIWLGSICAVCNISCWLFNFRKVQLAIVGDALTASSALA